MGPGFGELQVMCGAREHEAGMSLADTSDLSARTESGSEGREAMIGGDWAHGVGPQLSDWGVSIREARVGPRGAQGERLPLNRE